MTTNNANNEPTAASGKVLQGQGVGTTSAFSTATYPATATGTGTILRADGTNWAATTSTYPNTNAVSTLLYASSANVMAALATANSGVVQTNSSGVPSVATSTTWTPTVVGATSAGTASYTTQVGRYIQFGPLVFVSWRIVWTSGTGTGTINIGGLPVNILTTANVQTFGLYTLFGGPTPPANTADLVGTCNGSGVNNQIALSSTSDTGTAVGPTYTAAGTCNGNVWYWTA